MYFVQKNQTMNTTSYNPSHDLNNKKFSETQAFGGKNIFKILLIIPALILLVAALLWYLQFWFFWVLLIPGTVLTLVFSILHFVFHKAVMITSANKDGIFVQWGSASKTPRNFAWNDIQTLYRTANPRPGMSGSGWKMGWGHFYTMGNMEGIQLVMKNGDKIFIGSNEPEKFFNYTKQYLSQQ